MPDIARDHFARYYTEKLWDWIPGVYRNEDGLETAHKHVLRALIQAIGEHAAIARRSIDRLWDNQSIEMCDDWAVALIGELVGTRLVPALNRRGRRVDVARTIHYRRRSGTLHVLNQLILDIAGWDGAVVESFRTLGRAHHALDPLPLPLGRYTHTPRAGVADIRRARGAELTGGPWDEFFHTADLRPNRGRDGLHSIRGLNFHIYRQRAYRVNDATPVNFDEDGEQWTFDPSGRDTPLFMPSFRPEQPCSARNEWDVAGPIRCRLLGHAEYVITDAVLDVMADIPGFPAPALAELATMKNLRFRDEVRLRQTLKAAANATDLHDDDDNLHTLVAAALTADSAKATLVRDARAFMLAILDEEGQLPPERMVAGNLSTWALFPLSGKTVVVDPVRGRFWFPDGAPDDLVVPHYHYGFTGDIGAGTYDRRRSLLQTTGNTYSDGTFTNPAVDGVHTFSDSSTFLVEDVTFPTRLVLQAASLERPYLRGDAEAEATDWTITATDADAELTLEGLWYGGGNLIISGNFSKVTIRHCTLDPGGTQADGSPLQPAHIVVTGGVIDELVIESTIFAGVSLDDGSVLALRVTDCIASATIPTLKIDLPGAALTLERCTLTLPVNGLRVTATEILAQQPIVVVDHQNGCVRFSILAPMSHTPPIYRGAIADVPNHWFTSRRFGDPGYYALSETAPASVTRGAENGSEIGAFSNLIDPVKQDSLRTKIHEFMPLGRLPAFVRET
jgi:hypothetical protein